MTERFLVHLDNSCGIFRTAVVPGAAGGFVEPPAARAGRGGRQMELSRSRCRATFIDGHATNEPSDPTSERRSLRA